MNKQEFDPNLVTQFLNQYQDRGMMKWQGFYLSDHTASLNKVDREDEIKLNRRHSEQMALNEIESCLSQALEKSQVVRVERSLQDQNSYVAPFIEGKIEGYYQDKLMIGGEFIAINEIYAISLMK
ncbi:hypothetical protein [Latilactobacillus curvatus]|uniref:hypothetical protein n=1 Tax=Latilactobacillus curvatus TaxID=28038 RepID=UPI00223BA1D3|nr:hypothetical protein [Latilactobacillus curvatus]MCS8581661.1 hypothetical protein [Latilactobacillus curvatus]MCS8606193.1 hypothetical protein [Latilactobacillus curvatus]